MASSASCRALLAALFLFLVVPVASAQTYDRVEAGGSIPPDAVQAGETAAGAPIYLCVVDQWGGYYPGALGEDGVCRVAWGGAEHDFDGGYLVVVSAEAPIGDWAPGGRGGPPAGAYAAGSDEGGPVYVCRVDAWGGIYPGKLGDDGWCYVAHDGQEAPFAADFEVLVE